MATIKLYDIDLVATSGSLRYFVDVDRIIPNEYWGTASDIHVKDGGDYKRAYGVSIGAPFVRISLKDSYRYVPIHRVAGITTRTVTPKEGR